MPFFLYLFIYCYLLWLFYHKSSWDLIQGWPQRPTDDPLFTWSSSPKVLLEAGFGSTSPQAYKGLNVCVLVCVSSFGDTSSYAFFAHKTPSGTAVTQAHSILWGREKGTKRRSERSQEVQSFCVTGTQNDCRSLLLDTFSVLFVLSACTILHCILMHDSSYRSTTAVSKGH